VFRTSRQVAEHELRLASLSLAVAELRDREAKTMPAELLKLIESLQSDIETMRISLRSLHGKVAIAKRHEMERGNGRAAADIDDEFASLIELQKVHTGSN
jgi:hypothetical protein